MSQQTKHLSNEMTSFLETFSVSESPVEKELRKITQTLSLGSMQITPDAANYLKFIIHSHQFKNILEIGTFTGYSALAMALAIPDDGQVVCCEINDYWTQYSVPHWQKAKVREKISLNIAPAGETLESLIADDKVGYFDLAFIDADKTNYKHYYEYCLKLVRKGGIIIVDNIFWYGKTFDPQNDERQTLAIREITSFIYQDLRVKSCIVPIADGMMLAYIL